MSYEPPQQPGQPPKKKRHLARNNLGIVGGIVVLIIIIAVVAGCGGNAGGSNSSSSPAASATRYSSAAQVVAALKHDQMPCTGGSYDTPVVQGATSETQCNFDSNDLGLIDVFPGTVSTATVLKNSVSTGTQQIFSDVGPNWWVATSQADAQRVQGLLGGRVVAGPWHPSAASAPSSAAVPSFSPSAAPSPSPSQPDTVTFVVSGDASADVTYGPAGSDLEGSVPMDKTMTIPAEVPEYYAISAQLQGGGDVSCKIEVDGQVISSGLAEGGYNIAQCEIGQDPISGEWQNDNG